jgi:phosphatidylethanolamine/phosphatidyl-N-methylethanolamine N-methyltransferase
MRAEPDFETYHKGWSEAYQSLNYADTLSSRMIRQSHVIVERPFGPDAHFSRVLEVGSGGGQHFGYVRHRFDDYLMTDASDAMLEIARAAHAAPGVSFQKADAAKLPFEDARFDRLIAAHVLEHMERPHEVLREWARVLKPGATLSIVLPSDPGFAWRLGRRFGPRRNAERAGIAYDYWMAREHINPINGLVSLIDYYFDDVRAQWWPFRLPSMDLNLFYVCNIRV